jgi:DNA polymerase III subunit epsilon
LLESQLIKHHQPIYNRALRKNKFPFGLYHFTDERGYIQLHVAATGKMQEVPLLSFSSKRDATNQLERMVEEFELCQKLCNTYKSGSSCFRYTIKECHGACVQEEPTESYNERCARLIDDLMMNNETFYIVDKGRTKSEKSLVYVESGTLRGSGYAPFHFNRLKPEKWDRFIDFTSDDRDARTILKLFLRKDENHEIIRM